MSDDQLLGAVAVLIGIALVAGSGRLARIGADARRERRGPIDERLEQRHPVVMSERFQRAFARLWFLAVGATFVVVGIRGLSGG